MEEPTEYAPWVAKHGLRYPYGDCQCGCGQKAPIAKRNDLRDGILKGMPGRYLHGHRARINADALIPDWVDKFGLTAPYGECQCGCGGKTAIATHNDVAQGRIAGKPMRFIKGHHNTKLTAEQAFWAYAVPGNEGECWQWQGPTGARGYGLLIHNGQRYQAHRFSYELHYGAIPEGLFVCHHCDNPPCSNPTHLFAGSHSDNMADMVSKNRSRSPIGEQCHTAKLTEGDVREIRARSLSGVGRLELANQFGVSDSAIDHILAGRSWKHVK